MKPTRKTLLAGVAIVALGALGGVALASGDDGAEDAAEGPDASITGDALESASRAALDHLGGGKVTDTEVGDEESYYEVEVTRDDGSQIDVQLDESFNVVGNENETEVEDDDEGSEGAEAADDGEGAEDDGEDQSEGPDVAITGDPLTKASAKALEIVRQELGQSGKVTASEVGDEESYYEIEVTLDDGSQVDVQLDERFDFVGFD